MKVLQINNCHFPRGGADIMYLNTGELLSANQNTVFYFSSTTDSKDNIQNTLLVKNINFLNKSFIGKIFSIPRFIFSINSYVKLSSYIKKIKPDIAHIHLYKGTLTSSILLALKHNAIPTIISLHDYGLICPHNLCLDGKGTICLKCQETGNVLNCIIKKCNRNNFFLSLTSAIEYKFHATFIPFGKCFHKIIAVSQFGLDLHMKNADIRNKLTHLYNFYPYLESTIPSKIKGEYFLFYGRLSHEKGIYTLIKAWQMLNKDTTLKIVGNGPLKAGIQDLINGSGLNNIQLIGFKSGDELTSIIKQSSFVIVPSEWFENNPLTIIEAYANGKPVIGADIGGISEIIHYNETGFIFKSADYKNLAEKIQKAAETNEDAYTKMSVNARAFAENHFSGSKHYESLMNIYRTTINEMNLNNANIKK